MRVNAAPRIKTTVVGSYPVPEWLVAAPSEQGLIDATRVVIATQEQAGVDVVCDGELYRFDVNHPETNGMIEYFVRPMQGVRYEMTFDEVMAYRSLPGMRFRTRPPGVVDGPISSGTLDLPLACQRAAALATHTFKFTVTGPHMLAKTLLNRHYADTPELAHAIADVLAEQVRHLDADIVQIDEANLPGHPEEWEWAASAINRVLDAVDDRRRRCTCASATTVARACSSGTWEQLMRYLNALHADHVVLECAHRPPEELAVFKDLKPGDRLRPRRRRHQGQRGRVGRGGRARDRARRGDARRRPGQVHPPRLRLLDAEAPDRRRQDPRPGAGPRPATKAARA